MTPLGLLAYMAAGAFGVVLIGAAVIAVLCLWGWVMAPRGGNR